MSVIHIDDNNYNQVAESKKTVLIDFYSDWCGPCRMVAPIVEELANERDDVMVCKVNVDKAPGLSSAFKIYSIPTFIVVKDGVAVKRATGAMPKAKLSELLA